MGELQNKEGPDTRPGLGWVPGWPAQKFVFVSPPAAVPSACQTVVLMV